MSNTTGIEWTDATWNPIRGCSRVSEGCRNCYAERVAYRFSGAGQPYEGLAQLVNGHAAWTGKVDLVEKHLLDPLKWKRFGNIECVGKGGDARLEVESRPRRIFVNSMSDLFHPNVPDEWIDRIFAVMALCPQHTFQILTKRPERMLAYMGGPSGNISPTGFRCPRPNHVLNIAERMALKLGDSAAQALADLRQRVHGGRFLWPLPNVQLGVSVEDQKTAEERIPLLLQTPAAVRFISAEPLLGAIRLPRKVRLLHGVRSDLPFPPFLRVPAGEHTALSNPQGALAVPTAGGVLGIKPGEFDDLGVGLDWVICGGESGPGARPMHPDWARGLRDQCVAAGVPFFFKQWGEYADQVPDCLDKDLAFWMHPDGRCISDNEAIAYGDPWLGMYRVGKKTAGSLLDGREWKEFPR